MEGLLLLTDKEKIVRTPTYHAFRMYLPFQDATFVPVAFDAGRYTHGAITLPRVDAIAAKDSAGTLWLALTNIDPARPLEVSARLTGVTARSVTAETLTASAVDSVNTFAMPAVVEPRPVSAILRGDQVSLTLAPKSVTVLSVRQRPRGRLSPARTCVPDTESRSSPGDMSAGLLFRRCSPDARSAAGRTRRPLPAPRTPAAPRCCSGSCRA